MLSDLKPETLMWIVGGVASMVSGVSAFIATKISISTRMVEQTYAALMDRIEKLETHVAKDSEKIQGLMTLVETLRVREQDLLFKVQQLESAHADLPFPMWLKDLSGRMLYLNQKYEDVFLKPRGFTAKDYVGRKDEDIWPAEVAAELARRDTIVKVNRAVWHGVEIIPNVSGEMEKWVIVKFPRFTYGDVLVGIGGIAVPREYQIENTEDVVTCPRG